MHGDVMSRVYTGYESGDCLLSVCERSVLDGDLRALTLVGVL